MNKLFQSLCDLKSIEKSEREHLTDFDEHLAFQIVYLLHLESNRFLIVDDELEIIGDGKDRWFGRMNNYCEPMFFTESEISSYQEVLRQVK